MKKSTNHYHSILLIRSKSWICFIPILLVMLIAMVSVSCSNEEPGENDDPGKTEEPTINYHDFYYTITCDGDVMNEDGKILVSPQGDTYVFDLKAVYIESEDEYIELPEPDFLCKTDADWINSKVEGNKLTLTVLPNEERNVESRTGILRVGLTEYNTCQDLEFRVEQEAEYDNVIFKEEYFNDYNGYKTYDGWYFNKLGSTFMGVYFYVFEDEELIAEVSNPDFTLTSSEYPDKEYIGRKCTLKCFRVESDINTTGSTRECTLTIKSKSGLDYTRRIVQEYHSIGDRFVNSFQINGTTYQGWELDYRGYLCYIFIDDLTRGGVSATIDGYRVSLYANEQVYTDEYEDRYKLTFQISENESLNDYKATIYIKSLTTGEKLGPYTIYQKSRYGSSSGGSSDDGGGSGGSSDDTKGYTITSTSVCAIYALDNSSSGTKYTKNWYKWVSSTGRVILSTSRTSNSGWKGVASNNYDSTCKGYSVGSYKYKYTDYSPVGGTWYYYFN